MLRFLVDAQLPPALARKLSVSGHEATHVLDVGLLNASDSRIWDYALANQSIIVTKDEEAQLSLPNIAENVMHWIRLLLYVIKMNMTDNILIIIKFLF